jgi:hypothetical protein
VKRSSSIRLVLIGGLSAGAMTSCGPDGAQSLAASSSHVYTNNYQVSGVGFYHAPYRGWYPLPYNHFDPQKQQYFHGGLWTETPHQSITNISPPTPEMAQKAQPRRTDVPRSGFGSTSRHHSTFS